MGAEEVSPVGGEMVSPVDADAVEVCCGCSEPGVGGVVGRLPSGCDGGVFGGGWLSGCAGGLLGSGEGPLGGWGLFP
ncbi:hypothetical protein GCM10023318_37540 [Nocardia callitridis]|uniref:Uncharacterized protein n=1 Tax=Nocardia callitridis TaxID=648753 RepID=A0ABP9KJP0_9NOCA